ncbi:MAG: hypothetical protein ACLGQU_14675 [Acidobacteriota bacterium]
MNFRTSFVFLALASFSLPAVASKNKANNFTLVDAGSGKNVGKASYSIQQSKKGYKIDGRFEYSIVSTAPPAAGTQTKPDGNAGSTEQGQYDISYKLDSTGNFLSGSIQDQVAQKTYNWQPNKQRTTIEVSTIQAGSLGSPVIAKLPNPDFFMISDGDPSAIQILMTAAQTHPLPNSTYMLLIPEDTINPKNRFILVNIQPDADRTGTLDGKSVALKSFILRFHTGPTAEVYLDGAGNLMEADLPKLQLNYVRQNFTLSPAAK